MIDVVDCECGNFHTTLNGKHVFTCYDVGPCEKLARTLTEVRMAPFRNGVAILIRDLGFTEKAARELYKEVVDPEKEPRLQ